MQKGRVLKRIKGLYSILDQEKRVILCKAKGRLFFDKKNQSIAVGDIVFYTKSEEDEMGLICGSETRKSYLVRYKKISSRPQVILANIDQLILMTSLKSPSINIEFLIKSAMAAKMGNIKPIIVFSKIDLVEEEELKSVSEIFSKIGIEIFYHTIYQSQTTRGLKTILTNKLSAILGKSGVGKSSLINALFSNMQLKVGALQKQSQTGRHTTTLAEMFFKEDNIFIADTPGLRQFDLYQVNKHSIAKNFLGMEKLVEKCKYKNCLHQKESGCAVIEALEKNEYPQKIHQAYLKLLQDSPNL